MDKGVPGAAEEPPQAEAATDISPRSNLSTDDIEIHHSNALLSQKGLKLRIGREHVNLPAETQGHPSDVSNDIRSSAEVRVPNDMKDPHG